MSLLVSDEVSMAVASGSPVVALETSVIGQGLPRPHNLACAGAVEEAIRSLGVVPAWTAVVDGIVRVGLEPAEVRRLGEGGDVTKVARRDLPVAVASGGLGATTVSAMIWCADRAGITIGTTGGIGGVHPPGTDVSADLIELARTSLLLVCSGPKSIVDPEATAEKLEELGVAVVGYGVDRLPFFLARETGVELEHRVDTPDEAAALAGAQASLSSNSAILLCNPVPEPFALDLDELMAATANAQARMGAAGLRGKEVTPFLLSALIEETGGRSLESNLALLEANARLAAEVAVALARA